VLHKAKGSKKNRFAYFGGLSTDVERNVVSLEKLTIHLIEKSKRF
jgi:hypothetical protein